MRARWGAEALEQPQPHRWHQHRLRRTHCNGCRSHSCHSHSNPPIQRRPQQMRRNRRYCSRSHYGRRSPRRQTKMTSTFRAAARIACSGAASKATGKAKVTFDRSRL